MENGSVTIFLLGVQAILLIILLLVMSMLLSRISSTGEKVNALISQVDEILNHEVRPTLIEARKAVQHIDTLAQGAAGTLQAAEPVVRAVSHIATIFQKPATAMWLDAIRLAIGVFGIIKSKQAEKAEDNPELAAYSQAEEH